MTTFSDFLALANISDGNYIVGYQTDSNGNKKEIRFLASSIKDYMNALSLAQFKANQTYQGIVATHGFIPHAKTGSANQINSRTMHIATSDIYSLSAIYPNFYGAENKLGSVLNISSAVEYPIGVQRKRLLFQGSVTGVIPDGDVLRSDDLRISIPKGSKFYMQQYVVNPNNTGIVYSSYLQNSALGEGMNMVASGATDQSLTGSIQSNYANTIYGPMAIIGNTQEASVLSIGDSRSAGANEDHATISTESGMVTPSLYPKIGYSNVAVPGEQGSNFVNVHALRSILVQYVTHIICNYGINDLVLGSQTPSQVLATLNTLIGMFPKQKFYQCTILPKSSSTNNWQDAAGQTPDPTNPSRIIVNNAIRNGLAGASGFFETADAVEYGRDSGIWKFDGTANAFTSDGLHGSTRAYQGVGGIVASGAINPSILVR